MKRLLKNKNTIVAQPALFRKKTLAMIGSLLQVGLLANSPATFANNIINNPSFELDGLPAGAGWTIYSPSIQYWSSLGNNGSVELGYPYTYGVTGASGQKIIEIDVYGGHQDGVYQNILTQLNQPYQLSIDVAQRGGTTPANNAIDVFWRGTKVGTITPTSTVMTTYTFSVVGSGGYDELRIQETPGQDDGLGGEIDNVQLYPLGLQTAPPGPGEIPDYFGTVPNYANSPQPLFAKVAVTGAGTGAVLAASTFDYTNNVMTDKVMDVQVVNGGNGYTAGTTIQVSGGSLATPVSLTPIITNGVITGFNEIPNPLPAGWVGLGSGYTTPIANTGLRKFVDTLAKPNSPNNLGQQLPIAVPDTTTFPGSDYYEIAVTEYNQKLHSDLPATRLRGYKQLNAPAGSAAANNQYLGPMIVAQKDRPVRVKLVNQLPTGAAGNLSIPVDHTYMGANDTDNRTVLHLHGGNTPWISDGTPRQWVKPASETGTNKGVSAANVPDMWFDATTHALIPSCASKTTCAVANATNDPGAGTLTFYYTNQQSQRLMFYHDHTEGTTRLNVYGGMAAPYLLQDTTENAMKTGGAVNGMTYTQTLPPDTDMIPLIIQDKTFVPGNTTPVLNFYGAFKSQLNSQDPTWRWGSGIAASGLNGNGDLWVPHVYMPNQSLLSGINIAASASGIGANPLGRWDYGPWFWPPFQGLQNMPLANPYYDPNCIVSSTTQCEPKQIPGVPNGNTIKLDALSQPTGVPESFNDTPLVNGTAYPSMTVEPKKYRLRLLNAADDRMFNLSLVVAASKASIDTTAFGNAGTINSTTLCDGTTAVPSGMCTEVKMVPFNSTQNASKPFPSWWYTPAKGGVSFDDRSGGVFDPTTRGPAMVQIGNEGGFLATPATIRNQPVNFEYNVKNIVVTNIKEHALLLGPAERADVIVDFSQFAGSTLILYNDSPAPVPAFDLRNDYYTGDFDNTDSGGAFKTIPGYGPNTRTVMQINVAPNCSSANCGTGINRTPTATRPVDDVDATHLNNLTTAVRTAFRSSQEPIVVPQSDYNATYGTVVTDSMSGNISAISDTQLSFTPFADTLAYPATFQAPVTLNLGPKSIIENFTVDYGRMNAQLGVEVPRTTATTQTSIMQGYFDPPTELVKITPNATPISGVMDDGTQLWKITHNGVDTHPIHFHLFHVQLINRVGWDGQVRKADPNELGWKDIVRMNPLEDVIVALRPKNMTLPFKVPNSKHTLAPGATGANLFENLNPLTGGASNVNNTATVNFGWEYVWHCHILGHEENDMMRPIAVAKQPETPSNLQIVRGATGAVTLNWLDNSIISNWATIQRATDAGFTAGVVTSMVTYPECTSQTGCARTYNDNTAVAGTNYYYRVVANNTVGGGNASGSLPTAVASLTPNFTGYDNVTATSSYSNVATTNAPAYRYVMLQQVASPNNGTLGGAAEVTILDASGKPLSKTGWTATADSVEPSQPTSSAIDGNPNTAWVTRYAYIGNPPPPPHWLIIDMKSPQAVTGLRYLYNGTDTWARIVDYRVFLSNDGVNWSSPVSQGTLSKTAATEQQVMFDFSGKLGTYRYARLTETSEVNNGPWGIAAEINLLSATGTPLNRTGWTATADNTEVGYPANNVLDGNNASYWVSQWVSASPRPPHYVIVDMQTPQFIGGFNYLPRQDANVNGNFAGYSFAVSNDGVTWSAPAAQGTFANDKTLKSVNLPLLP